MKETQQIIDYLAQGRNLGISSKCMAYTALETTPGDKSYPSDPADFNRCLLLVQNCPQVWKHHPVIAEYSPEWKAIIENWNELERLFVAEVGWNWSKGKHAKRTYNQMKELFKQYREAA